MNKNRCSSCLYRSITLQQKMVSSDYFFSARLSNLKPFSVLKGFFPLELFKMGPTRDTILPKKWKAKISTSAKTLALKPPIHHFRFLLMLFLLFYAVGLILRLFSLPVTDLVEKRGILESLKTHVSSKKEPLQVHAEEESFVHYCSAVINGIQETAEGFLCCDRTHHRTDVCYMKGDIRTSSPTSSLLLYNGEQREESIRPYTRKWEVGVMKTIDEILLKPIVAGNHSINSDICDVKHTVPAIVFSTGGYTGNVYHEFNDGLLPLYITSERFNGEVVFVVLEYHEWWMTKYGGVVEKLTNYDLVDFRRDKRVHCFPETIVGMKIHDELTIDPSLMTNGKGMRDFQALLGQGLAARTKPVQHTKKPRLVIFTRKNSRVLLNIKQIVRTSQRIGFDVQILNPKRDTELGEIYGVVNASDVMLGVHGAAMTHFLFLRPPSVFIQIVPLGLDWAAQTYYGEPAMKLGLEYMEYKIAPHESSLLHQYYKNDPVIVNPSAVNSKGWEETKKIYLDNQNLRVDLKRFSMLLAKAHSHVRRRHHAS